MNSRAMLAIFPRAAREMATKTERTKVRDTPGRVPDHSQGVCTFLLYKGLVQYIEIQFLLVPAVLPEALNQVRTVSLTSYQRYVRSSSVCDFTILEVRGDTRSVQFHGDERH